MAFEEAEDVLVIPSVSGWIARFSGVPLKELIATPEAIVRAQIEAQKAVGYDALFAYIDPLYIPEAFGCPLVFLSSGPDVSPLSIKNEDDVEALSIPDIRRDGRLPVILKVAGELARIPERQVPVLGLVEGPFTTASRILSAERMMRDLIRNRSMVERLIEKVGELLSCFGRALAETGVDGLIVADPVSSSTMISPKIYLDMVLPRLKRFIESLPIPVILHVCGDTRPILTLMAESGARVLSLDQCMDLAKAKEALEGRCGIGGNVDPIQVLFLGTSEDVKRETLNCLEQGGKRGYILMAGCAVPAGTPIENLK
ncbi:MAG: hypothetical protein EHM36_03065, partial [Deltaproteobacteria bacterium]